MDCLNYPFDGEYILKKKLSIKRELLAENTAFQDKRIAILGGSTTDEIKNILELFLLNYGIKPQFYQSEYAQYWNDAMFSEELCAFAPDIIFVHTGMRNITEFPDITDSVDEVNNKFNAQLQHFTAMWDRLLTAYHCPIIQNNFERPLFRLLGNKDITDIHGRSNFIARLNSELYAYCAAHDNFYVNDVDYVAASYGIDKYSDSLYWNMYKYSMCLQAIPYFAYNLANIIKSIYGKNKKALVLDLDNTLWGGVVGDDGVKGIAVGPEVPMGQVYSEFQSYLLLNKKLGILLTIASKNDEKNALEGLLHPDNILRAEDFVKIKANWDNKDISVLDIAKELNIGIDSLVFVDDNPAEREIVKMQLPSVAVPNIGKVEQYIKTIDRSGFFEVTSLSRDDLQRSEMYKQNAEREALQQSFVSYESYLESLNMTAEIRDFEPIYMQRIAQLTVKSNQFNLTTHRYTEAQLEAMAKNDSYVRLYGKLHDKFGDNGVVSIVIGECEGESVHIRLWLMSCRVLKRQMENAMLDKLVQICKKRGAKTLIGYYYPTEKNGMVKDFYSTMGFLKTSEKNGATVWEYEIDKYENTCKVIEILE
ncbi:MAG: HAD-IIIC family phosphatase [Oscillospiraceae bacterium]